MFDLKSALESIKYNGGNPVEQMGMNKNFLSGANLGGQTGLNTPAELSNIAGNLSGQTGTAGANGQSVIPGVLKNILGALLM